VVALGLACWPGRWLPLVRHAGRAGGQPLSGMSAGQVACPRCGMLAGQVAEMAALGLACWPSRQPASVWHVAGQVAALGLACLPCFIHPVSEYRFGMSEKDVDADVMKKWTPT
jgi:hypothetical protein